MKELEPRLEAILKSGFFTFKDADSNSGEVRVRLLLEDTLFRLELYARDGDIFQEYWINKHSKVIVSFEEVLDSLNEDMQTLLLFHLDILS